MQYMCIFNLLPLFYMSMHNRSRFIDGIIVKLSLRYMLLGGVEIYPRCAKCVVPEGVRHRVKGHRKHQHYADYVMCRPVIIAYSHTKLLSILNLLPLKYLRA